MTLNILPLTSHMVRQINGFNQNEGSIRFRNKGRPNPEESQGSEAWWATSMGSHRVGHTHLEGILAAAAATQKRGKGESQKNEAEVKVMSVYQTYRATSTDY